jgi:hypothetical protein
MRLRRNKEEDHDVTISAAEARAQSEAALAAAKEKWPAVKQVTASLRGARQENNFSRRILASFKERP